VASTRWQEDDAVDAKLKGFEADVLKLLQKLPAADAPPACEWSKPDGTIFDKSEADLSMEAFEGGGSTTMIVLAGLAAAAAAGYAYYAGMLG
jgi:hypothetical protein